MGIKSEYYDGKYNIIYAFELYFWFMSSRQKNEFQDKIQFYLITCIDQQLWLDEFQIWSRVFQDFPQMFTSLEGFQSCETGKSAVS